MDEDMETGVGVKEVIKRCEGEDKFENVKG